MKMVKVFVFYFCLTLLGCAVSGRVDNRNFAVDTYVPTPNETQLAQQRAQRYWQKNAHRFSSAARYLAVSTTSIVRGDIVSNFYPQLINSETTASFFSQGEPDELNASCIMIYDTVAKQFVSHNGYISVDLPPRGSIAHWDKYAARYIGWGG